MNKRYLINSIIEIFLAVVVVITAIIDSRVNTEYSRFFFLLSALIFLLFVIINSIKNRRVLIFTTHLHVDESKNPAGYYISLTFFCLLALACLFFLILTLTRIIA